LKLKTGWGRKGGDEHDAGAEDRAAPIQLLVLIALSGAAGYFVRAWSWSSNQGGIHSIDRA
jgi:hypothetical protein